MYGSICIFRWTFKCVTDGNLRIKNQIKWMKPQYVVFKVSKGHKVLSPNILIDNVSDFVDCCFENNF